MYGYIMRPSEAVTNAKKRENVLKKCGTPKVWYNPTEGSKAKEKKVTSELRYYIKYTAM